VEEDYCGFLEIPRKQLASDSVIFVFVKTFNSESKCASVHAFVRRRYRTVRGVSQRFMTKIYSIDRTFLCRALLRETVLNKAKF
jgi:hypothetical protein